MRFVVCLGFVIWSLGLAASAAIITNVEPTSLSDDTFIITWSTTDESASTEILWGVSGLTTTSTVSSTNVMLSGTTKYHSAKLTGLYPNLTYQYRIKSGRSLYPPSLLPASTFTTLTRPIGEHLFDFAVLNDLRYANGKPDKASARGIAYSKAPNIITSEVADINNHNVAFTVVNGNIIDSASSDPAKKYGDQASSEVKPKLENLTNNLPSDKSNIAYKYMPVPGYHDKKTSTEAYTTDWITNSFKPLTSGTSIESQYGYNAASKDADAIFNYQFAYKFHNFIFLDSVKKPGDALGLADLSFLYKRLSAESNTKTFIFMAYPAYNPLSATYKDYSIDLPTSEVGGAFNISNDTAFRATIEAFKDKLGNPIVAAVISSHLGDNFLRTIGAISYVRQGPAVQYPTGYSIYKVYTNGYVKTFYKTTGRDGTDKPYYEYARDQISGESGLPAAVFTAFWLGTNSMCNFTYTYPFIPGVAPTVQATSPTSNESAVSLNRPIIINFSERMLNSGINNWVTVSPSVGTLTARFLDSANTVLSVSHSDNFVEGQTYTVTVSGSLAQDEGSTIMSSNYVFTFNTSGGLTDTTPPASTVTPLPNNSTTDPFPLFTGVASDDSGVINVEYRFDNTGAWLSAEAVDGTFNSTNEVFRIRISSALAGGTHALWLRTTDSTGNISTEGVSAYSFTIAENKPAITIKVNGHKLYNGDTIAPTPKFELTITSANSLETGRISVDGTVSALTSIVRLDTNYYATHEVTSALADGLHGLTVEAFDSQGNGTTAEVYPLYVQAGKDAAVQGTPLNYPNPYEPAAGNNTTIGYTLTKPASITLTIHDLGGTQIAKKSFTASENGGLAGYNTVAWNGKSDAGDYAGNGIYIYLIVADGRVLAKGKLTVLKR